MFDIKKVFFLISIVLLFSFTMGFVNQPQNFATNINKISFETSSKDKKEIAKKIMVKYFERYANNLSNDNPAASNTSANYSKIYNTIRTDLRSVNVNDLVYNVHSEPCIPADRTNYIYETANSGAYRYVLKSLNQNGDKVSLTVSSSAEGYKKMLSSSLFSTILSKFIKSFPPLSFPGIPVSPADKISEVDLIFNTHMQFAGNKLIITVSSCSNTTYLLIFDLSNPKSPQYIEGFAQSGGFDSEFVFGQNLVIGSDYYVSSPSNSNNISSFIPVYNLKATNHMLKPSDLYIQPNGSSYQVVTMIDLSKQPKIVYSKAVWGYISGMSSTPFSSQYSQGYIAYANSNYFIFAKSKLTIFDSYVNTEKTNGSADEGYVTDFSLYSINNGISLQGSKTLTGLTQFGTAVNPMVYQKGGYYLLLLYNNVASMTFGSMEPVENTKMIYTKAKVPVTGSANMFDLFVLNTKFDQVGMLLDITNNVDSVVFNADICTLKNSNQTIKINFFDPKKPFVVK